MDSRNPAFRSDRFGQQMGSGHAPSPQQLQDMYNQPAYTPPAQRTMTIDDVVVKSAAALGVLVVTAALTWALVPVETGLAIAFVAFLLQFGLAMFISFGQRANAPLVLAFSAVYGVGVGGLSHYYDARWDGIVFQAVLGTALAFSGMLAVHTLRVIRMTPKTVRFIIAAGWALVGLMLVNLVVSLFNDDGIGIREPTPLGITFSVVAILVGCFFLLLDFDTIEQGVRAGAPEKFAWYCAFGLVLSLVWIYLELLRLLSYFRD